jgi:5-methylcytosine-specific restriction endonuclease McrA
MPSEYIPNQDQRRCGNPECAAILAQRDGESAWNFRKRKSCSKACADAMTGVARRTKVAAEEDPNEVRACEICGGPIPRKEGEPRWRWVQRFTCGSVRCRRDQSVERPQLDEKPCKNCGETMVRGDIILARFKAREFCCYECSAEHRQQTIPTEKTCVICSVVFFRSPGMPARDWRARETCSEECRYALIAKSNSEANPAYIPPPKYCQVCGVIMFKRSDESHPTWNAKKACDQQCAGRLISGDRKVWPEHYCLSCGVLIPRRKGEQGKVYAARVTCSRRCAISLANHTKATNAQPTHPYGGAEWRRLRAYVFERDGYQCQLCQSEHVELHAHHVDYDNRHNDPDLNLITLCKPCHGQTNHGDREAWTEMFRAMLLEKLAA